ncbi:MAG: hypothetical protein COW01_11810 [Bdellovibrionales bacterium CG12_big_fil_rev_8_21_14_0_65_38_15]|nr:MAG: hypothetical protein COW79_01430 [Bdellovibrionales bacterium CG22_combo_CG10-13_8_21_14_all_38_13]PIQ54019.1 MAG: hypothetical protein COW01_11810 [Bdellovibrionales bacterium CG12_big_fil_rev_8_21_14_0_65_38_15]PIR29710.1 MAG: hypothetical protein COV38_09265 [Bdellovibrionales bacterium CG11_big_fil_rev_8_21_14_0_20_38_13]
MKNSKRIIFFCCGWISIILGVAGIFLPILPTTPFAILAAWCFSKSSERWHQWLLNHKIFGPTIRDWERDGVINPRAKALATSMIVLLFSYTLIFVKVHIVVKSIVTTIGISVLFFIWTRPSKAKQ